MQGVVTYKCRVEALVIWIKIESKLNQVIKAFLESPSRNQGNLLNCENQQIKHARQQLDLWPVINQVIKCIRREQSSNQAHFLPIKNLDPGGKHFNRWHISDYILFLDVRSRDDFGWFWMHEEVCGPYASVYGLCPMCKHMPNVLLTTSWVRLSFPHPRGCKMCSHSGHRCR